VRGAARCCPGGVEKGHCENEDGKGITMDERRCRSSSKRVWGLVAGGSLVLGVFIGSERVSFA